ncbi:hypothetical protein BG005_003910, partial [Podila minutissima]
DFNGAMDPRVDRSPQRGGAKPETELLQWLQTQALYDAYRSIHPTARGYSFRTTSRIDMVFVSQTLAHRFIQCTHDSLEGIADSDHQMVNVSLTLHGSQHLTRHNHQRYARPTGFRFLFREAEADDFNEFSKNLTLHLEKDKEQLEAIGIRPLDEKETEAEAEKIDVDRLRRIDLERGWTLYSKAVMKAAKATIPGKKVGRSGVKPAAELSVHHLIRALSRIKSKLKRFKDGDLTTIDMYIDLDAQWTRYSEQAQEFSQNTEQEVEVLPVIPDKDTARIEDWIEAHKMVSERWMRALHLLQAAKEFHTQNRIREAIENRCAQLQTATSKMIDKVLGRSQGKVVIDRVQVEVNGAIVNALEPNSIKDHVRAWFKEWHGPRPSQPLEPGSRWEKQYQPIETIQDNWYAGLMVAPTLSEFKTVVNESPKHKASGSSGVSNDLFQRQGQSGNYILFQLISACIMQENMPKERLSEIFMCHGILRGPNFSVLKGTTTKDPLHILNAAMEDAREHKKELWIVFQDMKRCFDSVNCHPDGMLSRGLGRLRVPQSFVRLCENVALTKANKVITEYGTTDEYHPECGLDQGGVECPLLWRVA